MATVVDAIMLQAQSDCIRDIKCCQGHGGHSSKARKGQEAGAGGHEARVSHGRQATCLDGTMFEVCQVG